MAALSWLITLVQGFTGSNGGHLLLTRAHTLHAIFLTHAFILILGKWPIPKLDMKEMGAYNQNKTVKGEKLES